MERMDESNIDPVVYFIHEHRYRWARHFARGVVLDVACGIGYGSSILLSGGTVEKYLGIDFSGVAVRHAQQKFSGPSAHFIHGDAHHLALPEQSVDTIISLETIEHLPEPEMALREFGRVLKPGGLLIGSVPSVEYEEISEEVHGPNPYHLRRFELPELRALLAKHFFAVQFYTSEIDMVTTFKSVPPAGAEVGRVRLESPPAGGKVWGSYFFVAHKGEVASGQPAPLEDSIYYGISAIDYEKIRFLQFREALAAKDSLIQDIIREKDRQISEYRSLFFKPHRLARKAFKKVFGK
jgi:SAM-dependent methyltransferase